MKNIVITGSSKGLGFEMAKCFLANGHNVTISGSNIQNLVLASEKLASHKEHFFTILCDVRKRDDVENLWLRSKDKWGNIDIWINNAGVPQPESNLWEIEDDRTKKVLETNLLGMVAGCQVAINGMLLQGNGYVYNVEGFGSNGSFMKGLNLYGTTKRALTHITRAFAKELKGTTVRIGFLGPGMMSTEFVTGNDPDHVIKDSTRQIFNILGDKPCRPASFLVKRILNGTSNGQRIEWLTKWKIISRFIKSIFVKRNIFD
jgi:NAD(P)-dependent dehydrogenase (short-subunit alcohol dehydrogenase family)